MARRTSFRFRMLLVVLVVAGVPLGLVGLWISGSMSGAGEEVLRSHLEDMLDRTVRQVGLRWLRYRSDLLYLAEDSVLQRTLTGSSTVAEAVWSERLHPHLDAVAPLVRRAVVRDAAGERVWTLDEGRRSRAEGTGFADAPYDVDIAIYERVTGDRIGTLALELDPRELLGRENVTPTVVGAVVGAFDVESRTALLTLSFDPDLLAADRFSWGGDEWIAIRQRMSEPPVELVVAAPLSRFSEPLERAAGRGLWFLALTGLVGMTVAFALTGRMARSLEALAAAADAVTRGELERSIEDSGMDEVGRVARSFNAMTRSLRRTLEELAHHERLAAMGEFAASLAHEVRNPLTAIRVDLQRVERGLEPESPLRGPQSRALREIERLDATVARALDAARPERAVGVLDLREPIRAAIEASGPAFEERGATLSGPEGLDEPVHVPGEVGALEQLLLNLLLNAAAALGPRGIATVEVEERGEVTVVRVRDTGPGIASEILERVFEPQFTTRSDGNGLGLTIAQRIAEAHGGSVEIESEVGRGTCVAVSLPRAPSASTMRDRV